jgi:hypothetical protein
MIIHSRIHSIAFKILSSSFMNFFGINFRHGFPCPRRMTGREREDERWAKKEA